MPLNAVICDLSMSAGLVPVRGANTSYSAHLSTSTPEVAIPSHIGRMVCTSVFRLQDIVNVMRIMHTTSPIYHNREWYIHETVQKMRREKRQDAAMK